MTDQISNFGEIEDVPHDDNCSYHSTHFDLQAIRKTNLLKSPEILYFIKILYDHAKNSFDELKNRRVFNFFSDDPDLKKK